MKKNNSGDLIREMAAAFPISVVVHKSEDGEFWVDSKQLGGCFASGRSVADAVHNFKLALFEYFDVPKSERRPDGIELRALNIPEPKSVKRPAVASFFSTPELFVVS